MGKCKYELCKDWHYNGCGWHGVHDFSGSIPNIVWSCNGGCCNGVTSYSTRSETDSGQRVGNKQGGGECENTELIAYEKPHYKGHSQPMRGHYRRIDRIAKSGCREDWWASIRERKIPQWLPGKLSRIDTNAECHGADAMFKKVAGKTNACFYSATDASKIRSVFSHKDGNTDMSSLFYHLKREFCSKAGNVFKNPGGGSCLEYDEGKRLAKEYCRLSGRIITDASCTKYNLGNHYEDVATEHCNKNGRYNQWCSCYNVSNDVCKTRPTAAGCKEKKQTYDKLVEATPQDYKNSWNGMAPCFGKVCVGKKYIPENSNQNCNRPVQVCVQDFNIQSIADSTIYATCDQTANTNTQPSAGDSPSGQAPTPAPGPNAPLNNNPQSTATETLENLTDQQKRIVISLFMAILFLILILIIF